MIYDGITRESLLRHMKLLSDYELLRQLVGYTRPLTTADIGHSAVITRLTEGKQLYKYAPPRCYSSPWYSLLDTGEAKTIEVFHNDELGYLVGQCTGWSVVNVGSNIREFDLQWKHYNLTIRCTPAAKWPKYYDITVLENDNPLVESIFECQALPPTI